MKKVLPPPIIFMLSALLMWLMANWLPYSLPYSSFFALLLLLASFLVASLSLFAFFKAKTSIDPFDPNKTTTLITTGVYKLSRNPMYLSLALALSSWAIWLGGLLTWLGLVVFVAYINHFQILPEEQILQQKFGTAYQDYLNQVRRWL